MVLVLHTLHLLHLTVTNLLARSIMVDVNTSNVYVSYGQQPVGGGPGNPHGGLRSLFNNPCTVNKL
jgi:hypothetical protein